jgi:hypothetical protein
LLLRLIIGELFIGKLESFCSLDLIFSNEKFSSISMISYYLRRYPISMVYTVALEGSFSTVAPLTLCLPPH